MSADDERFQERVKPRLAASTRWVLRALVALSLLAAAYWAQAIWSLRSGKASLLERRDKEALGLAAREKDCLDVARAAIGEAASPAGAGDLVDDELKKGGLARRLATQGLYVRAAVSDVRRARAVPEAIRRSAKDALVYCLLTAPEAKTDYDLVVASTRAPPGSPAFDEATRAVARLDVVQRGLRVFASEWPDEVRGANRLGLRALEYEFEQRPPEAVAAAKAWTRASYLLVVVDELPAGMEAPSETTELAASFEAPTLPAIQPKPHAMRVALFDRATKKPLLRIRREVDPPALALRTGAVEAAAAEDCRVAVAARRLADGE